MNKFMKVNIKARSKTEFSAYRSKKTRDFLRSLDFFVVFNYLTILPVVPIVKCTFTGQLLKTDIEPLDIAPDALKTLMDELVKEKGGTADGK